jgi:drug/metabolite transporter (DMT)-like permease
VSKLLASGWSGALLAIASAALFGASTPFAKLLLGNGIDPWLLAALLYLGSGLALAAVLMIRHMLGIASTEAPLRRPDLPKLVLVILSGGMLGPILLMLGLTLTAASTAALLLNLEGLATMLIAWLVFRENVDRRLLLGAFAILTGAVLLSWQSGPAGIGWGALLIACACLAWGIDNNLTRSLSASDPMQIACIKGLVAGGINFGLALVRGVSLPSASAAAGAAAIGILGYGVSLVLFIIALRRLGTARTSAYYSTAPFIGAALAIVISGEPVTAVLLVAAALMAIGVYLHLAERHEHFHVHTATQHEHRHVHDEHHQHDHGPNDPAGEPHTHVHVHAPMSHRHRHYPDLHHRHRH